MCCDLENFYLGTPLDQYEYIRLSIKIFPRILLMHKTFLGSYTMVAFTVKYSVECTDYRKQAN